MEMNEVEESVDGESLKGRGSPSVMSSPSSLQQPAIPMEALRRPSATSRNSLVVPPTSDPTCYLDVPSQADPESVSNGSRRCSARMLSINLQHTLRQLRREEHNARVTALLQRNAIFYQRQRCCECITMLSVLFLFTCFSLYIVFAHGFHFGKEKPFNLLHNFTRKIVKQEDEVVEVKCQADHYWEWCRWIHMDRFCDFEWVSSGYGVQEIGCDFPDGKLEFIGDYNKKECGLRIHNLSARDRGPWMCEVEKYYTGFSRRYGELRQAIVNLVIHERPRTSTTSIPSSPSSLPSRSPSSMASSASPASTGDPMASALTPNSHANHGLNTNSNLGLDVAAGETLTGNATASSSSTTQNPLTELQEYERQFFLLRVFVLGSIGCVLSTLALMFWIYFMYLWKTWDTTKGIPKTSASVKRARFAAAEIRMEAGGGGRGGHVQDDEYTCEPGMDESDADDNYSDEDDEEDPDGVLAPHPHFNSALRHSRRKSVSFAVCKVDKETMQFEIENKSVLLGNMSQHATSSGTTSGLAPAVKKLGAPASPLLNEVAKKWKEAKNKLVLKDQFEFPEEIFEKRRRELLEKAKQLEAEKEATAARRPSAAFRDAAKSLSEVAKSTSKSIDKGKTIGGSSEKADTYVITSATLTHLEDVVEAARAAASETTEKEQEEHTKRVKDVKDIDETAI